MFLQLSICVLMFFSFFVCLFFFSEPYIALLSSIIKEDSIFDAFLVQKSFKPCLFAILECMPFLSKYVYVSVIRVILIYVLTLSRATGHKIAIVHYAEIPTVGRSTRMHSIYQNLDNIPFSNVFLCSYFCAYLLGTSISMIKIYIASKYSIYHA